MKVIIPGKKRQLTNADWADYNNRIIAGLDIIQVYREMGVTFAASEPRASGKIECYSRERGPEGDNKPSAYVDTNTGHYGESSGNGENMSLWDFTMKYGGAATWQEARDRWAERAQVPRPNGAGGASGNRPACPVPVPNHHANGRTKKSGDFKAAVENQLKLRNDKNRFYELTARKWCERKQGIDWRTAIAAGLIPGEWVGQWIVAFPTYTPLDFSKPTGINVYRRDGEEFSAVEGKGIFARKTHRIRGSASGIFIAGDPEQLMAADAVWVCEGIPDALSLGSRLPAGEMAICTACGAMDTPEVYEMLKLVCAGKEVIVIPHADPPGVDGARRKAAAIAVTAKESRLLAPLFEMQDKHGKDVRDFFIEGHDIEELQELAGEGVIVAPDPNATPPESPPETAEASDAEDDPPSSS